MRLELVPLVFTDLAVHDDAFYVPLAGFGIVLLAFAIIALLVFVGDVTAIR